MTDRAIERTPLVIAFSESEVLRLCGLSRRQLRYWERIGFFSPSLDSAGPPRGGTRLFSFRDLVGLRALGWLRANGVPLQHLRRIADQLSELGQDLWTRKTIYVLGKRVVLDDNCSGTRRDALSGQAVLELPLRQVMADLETDVRNLRERRADAIGRIERRRGVVHGAPIISGTRIKTSAIRDFHQAGYSIGDILREYPDLTPGDVKAALEYEAQKAA